MADDDSVLLTSGIIICFAVHGLGRMLFSKRLSAYHSLNFETRFDWDQRLVNLTLQTLLCPFNTYILFYDRQVLQDPLYGYSRTAHVGFLLTIGFYLYDSILYLAHPKVNSWTKRQWLIHHWVTIALLLWNTSSKRMSAFPAATFLISSAGHITNEIRWFAVKIDIQETLFYDVLNVLCNMLIFLTCILPPPYMMIIIARQLDMSVVYMMKHAMKWSCSLGTLIVYIPHCILLLIQIRRTMRGWNKGPKSVISNTIAPVDSSNGTMNSSTIPKKAL